jgi:hypothetical protein
MLAPNHIGPYLTTSQTRHKRTQNPVYLSLYKPAPLSIQCKLVGCSRLITYSSPDATKPTEMSSKNVENHSSLTGSARDTSP